MTALGLAPRELQSSIGHYLIAGLVTISVLTLGVGGLAATTEISGAVVSSGTVVVGTGLTRIQHPNGGVVKEVLVHEGDQIRWGDVLMRLDETQVRANLAIVETSLLELNARQARLNAELDGADKIAFPLQMSFDSNPLAVRVMESEQRVFSSRQTSLNGQRSQLLERVAQFEQQVAGLEAAGAAKDDELVWLDRELESVRESYAKQMVQLSRLSELERSAAALRGAIGQLQSSISETRGRIAETKLQMLQVDDEHRRSAAEELRQVEAQIAELNERQRAASDQLDRVEIRAPLAGTINEISIASPGEVVSPGEQIMTISPADGELTVEARVALQNIDQLHIGQTGRLKFTAFNQRSTPELDGTLDFIAPDPTLDPLTRTNSYVVRIKISAEQLALLDGLSVVSGMPVETFIQTEQRTLLSYLLRPLTDQMAHMFRE